MRHTDSIRSMSLFRSQLVLSRFRSPLAAGPDVSTIWSVNSYVLTPHIREPRAGWTIFRWFSWPYATIMLRDSVFRHGVLTAPCCTITACKDPCSEARLVFHMILRSTPPYRTNWGLSFTRLRHNPPEVLSTLRAALFFSYYVRCVAPQRFLADVFGTSSRTVAVKLFSTRVTSQSSKLLMC